LPQPRKQRASYGKRVLEGLAERLQVEFGKGFDQSNLRNMRAFFVIYPIRDALRRELSWTHYRLLLRVDNPAARAFYEAEAVNARSATRELERQINSLLRIDLVFYNRLTRSFVLLDIKVGKLTHQELGQMQMYVNYYQRELTAWDANPPIGIVLCTNKSEAVVRYALPEGNTQIYASRYKLHLPTEEELAAELQRERRQIEFVERLGRRDATHEGE